MKNLARILSIAVASVSVSGLLLSGQAVAHVSVKPAEVLSGAFQTFTVSVPNEKDISTVSIRLSIPDGVEHVTPSVKPGWQTSVVQDGEGDEATVSAIIWEGSEIPNGFRDDFSFSAKVPEDATDLQWHAYQTYADGSTVAWDLSDKDQPKAKDGSPDFSKSGPYSITTVARESAADRAVAAAKHEAQAAERSADRALLVGGLGVVFGLAGIFFGTRKAKQ